MMDTASGLWERTRRNHGLEHATIALLLAGAASGRPMAGYSVPYGFAVVGTMSSGEVESAAREALRRMQDGEGGLAVSPFCGTNIVVAGALAAGAALLGRRAAGGGIRGVGRAFSGAVMAVAASRPIGAVVQRRFTTSADVGGMRVESVRGADLGSVSVHWVATSFR